MRILEFDGCKESYFEIFEGKRAITGQWKLCAELIRQRSYKMDKSFLITVTADDIKQGCRSDLKLCPIARAVSRSLDVQNISVGGLRCYWLKSGNAYSAALTLEAQDFVQLFDSEQITEPFNFVISDIALESRRIEATYL